jgi:hypothetical protein
MPRLSPGDCRIEEYNRSAHSLSPFSERSSEAFG